MLKIAQALNGRLKAEEPQGPGSMVLEVPGAHVQTVDR